jgi:hypothetical protein
MIQARSNTNKNKNQPKILPAATKLRKRLADISDDQREKYLDFALSFGSQKKPMPKR